MKNKKNTLLLFTILGNIAFLSFYCKTVDKVENKEIVQHSTQDANQTEQNTTQETIGEKDAEYKYPSATDFFARESAEPLEVFRVFLSSEVY